MKKGAPVTVVFGKPVDFGDMLDAAAEPAAPPAHLRARARAIRALGDEERAIRATHALDRGGCASLWARCVARRSRSRRRLQSSKEPPSRASTRRPRRATRSQANARGATPRPRRRERPTEHAEVGKPAPDFALKDLDGKEVQPLVVQGQDRRARVVQPGLPVREGVAHEGLAQGRREAPHEGRRRVARGELRRAGQAGRTAPRRTARARRSFGIDAPDPPRREPAGRQDLRRDEHAAHVSSIDDKGTLVYRGAIDNSPDGEGESPAGGKLVSYVDDGARRCRGRPPGRDRRDEGVRLQREVRALNVKKSTTTSSKRASKASAGRR